MSFNPHNRDRCYCRKFKVLNTILVQGVSLTIVVEPIVNPIPQKCYEIDCCFDWNRGATVATGSEVITISDGAVTYPVLDNIADPLTVSEIKDCCCNDQRVILRMVFGALPAPGHFQVRFPNTCCHVPCFTPVTAALAT